MTTLHRLLYNADIFQERRAWLAFPVAVVKKMSNDQGGSLAALIAYYGLLSLFPLLLVFAAILGFVLAGHPLLQAEVLRTTERSFPAMSGFIGQTLAGSNVALGVGLAGALWAGLGVSMATERAMNTVWNIPMSERPNVWRSRLRGFAMLAILGTTFLLSTALAGLPSTHGLLLVPLYLLGIIGPFFLDLVLYLLAFQVLTNRHLAWRNILPGAVLGAVGWTALQRLGIYYARHEVAHASHLYGSLAAVIGILAWIYLGAQLTLYAAEVNVVLAERLWPRSFSGMRTKADWRSLVLEAQQESRGSSECIMVTFDKALSALSATIDERVSNPVTPMAHNRQALEEQPVHADVVAAIEHLQAYDVCLQEINSCDPKLRPSRLFTKLHHEASETADALIRLAHEEPDLANALRNGLP